MKALLERSVVVVRPTGWSEANGTLQSMLSGSGLGIVSYGRSNVLSDEGSDSRSDEGDLSAQRRKWTMDGRLQGAFESQMTA